MKPMFQSSIGNLDGEPLRRHIQSLTTAMTDVTNRKLNITDNLDMAFYQIQATSGVPFRVSSNQISKLSGVIPILYNCTIETTTMRVVDSNSVDFTVTFTSQNSTEQFTLLLLGA